MGVVVVLGAAPRRQSKLASIVILHSQAGGCAADAVGGGAGLLKGAVLGPLLEATFIEVVEKVLGLEDGAMERTTSVIVM